MIWSEEQKRAIELEGNLLVSAAAGAGKTAVMTERIASRIAAGTKVDELLVVTFTRAAASEMRERIEKRLYELAENETDAGKKRLLTDAAADVSRANISTIHSFCKNVLKRNYHRVGIDPAFRVGSEDETVLLRNKALDDITEQFYLENEQEPTDASLFLIRAFHKNKGISSIILSIYNFVIARPEPEKRLSKLADAYKDGFYEASKAAADFLISVSKHEAEMIAEQGEQLLISGEADENFADRVNGYINDLYGLSQLVSYDSWYKAANEYAIADLRGKKRGIPASEKLKRYRKKTLADFKKRIKERFTIPLSEEKKTAELLYPAVKKLTDLVLSFISRYSELKQQEALIDFSDMEQLTLKVLSVPEVAEEYRSRFRYVFVDEYQDTNLVQDSIITAVSRGNNLFMVGDVKQSIYGFRQAEPAGFTGKYNSYDGVIGTKIDLNTNYRSATSILNATNFLFSRLMLGSIGEIDYSNNGELRSEGDRARGSAELMLIEMDPDEYEAVRNCGALEKLASGDGDEKSSDTEAENNGSDDDDDAEDNAPGALEELETIEAEAEFIADRILRLMNEMTVFDKETKSYRKACFSDFAVLMRKTSGFALRLVNTLSERGIPCTAELTDGYFNALEVQIFINLLRIIDNLRQDIPLVSVMRSSIGGFEMSELAEMRMMAKDKAAKEKTAKKDDEKKEERFIDGVKLAAELARCGNNGEVPAFAVKARDFLDRILGWRRLSRLIGIEELIGRLLDETRFYTMCGALRGGPVRQANLDILLEKAREFENNGRRGLHAFIEMMDTVRTCTNMGSAQASNVDAVRVTSIHKSKGLEYPVVFLCGLGGFFSSKEKKNQVILDGDLGIALTVGKGFDLFESMDGSDLNKTKKLLFRRAIEAKNHSRQIAEEMRILYVGMTRARERLCLVAAKKKMGAFCKNKAVPLNDAGIIYARSYLDWILGAFFPLGIDLGNAIAGTSVDIGGDSLKVRFGMSLTGENSDARLGKEALEKWHISAAEAPHDRVDKALDTVYPYENETKKPARSSVTDHSKTQYEYVPAVPGFLTEGRSLGAAEKGIAVHRFIMLMPIGDLDEAAVEEELSRLTAAGLFTKEEADAVKPERIAALIRTPLYQRLIASGAVRREQEFSLLTEEGALMQGIVDCFFIEDGGIVVIDYKTTALKGRTPEETAADYVTQLDMYARALEKLTGLPVKERWIYLLSCDTAVML